jgi:hypothetical protein
MAKYSKSNQVSPETQDEALKIARGIQRPGQTKEQTKLIAQGIQKGIDQYKKQYKAKVRELDRKSKKLTQKTVADQDPEARSEVTVAHRQSLIPWLLLVISWVAFLLYLFFS